jgi:hypothetical protein
MDILLSCCPSSLRAPPTDGERKKNYLVCIVIGISSKSLLPRWAIVSVLPSDAEWNTSFLLHFSWLDPDIINEVSSFPFFCLSDSRIRQE